MRAQGAEDSGDDCILVDVCAVVIASLERDELRVWDFFGGAPSLVEEVGVSGAEDDEASDLPRPEVLGDRSVRQDRRPRYVERGGIIVEPAPPARLREADVPERLQRSDEGLRASGPRRATPSVTIA